MMNDRAGSIPSTRASKVEVDGATLYVEQTGVGGDSVIFSHGLFLTKRLFDAPVAALADRCRCVAYDHRGQGASVSRQPSRTITLERLYDDALTLVQRLEVAPCHWVGQSAGGFVGMRLAARRPDLVRSLVLLSPRIRRNPRSFLLRVELFCQAMRVARPFGVIDGILRRRLADEVMHEMLAPTFMSDPASSDDRAEFRADLFDRLVPAAVPGIRGTVRYPENSRQLLARIKVPTLLIAGEEDYSYPGVSGVEHAHQVQAAITGSRLFTVPGAGHSVLLEQPTVVSEAIKTFVVQISQESQERGGASSD